MGEWLKYLKGNEFLGGILTTSRCHQGREATPSIYALPLKGEGYSMRGASTTPVNFFAEL
jgi:hypothetical protein